MCPELFSQSASSASADPDMTQMGMVGTGEAIPRLPRSAYASCTRNFASQNNSKDSIEPSATQLTGAKVTLYNPI